MNKNELLILIGISTAVLIIINLLISIKISQILKKKGVDARIANRRGIIFKYLWIYISYKLKEGGKPGVVYYSFIISFILFVSLLIAGVLISSF